MNLINQQQMDAKIQQCNQDNHAAHLRDQGYDDDVIDTVIGAMMR